VGKFGDIFAKGAKESAPMQNKAPEPEPVTEDPWKNWELPCGHLIGGLEKAMNVCLSNPLHNMSKFWSWVRMSLGRVW
jgi:hypothetical protein